jgi:hypothetical protein
VRARVPIDDPAPSGPWLGAVVRVLRDLLGSRDPRIALRAIAIILKIQVPPASPEPTAPSPSEALVVPLSRKDRRIFEQLTARLERQASADGRRVLARELPALRLSALTRMRQLVTHPDPMVRQKAIALVLRHPMDDHDATPSADAEMTAEEFRVVRQLLSSTWRAPTRARS